MAPPGLLPLHAEADGLVLDDAGGDHNEHVGDGVGAAAEAAQQPAERVPPGRDRDADDREGLAAEVEGHARNNVAAGAAHVDAQLRVAAGSGVAEVEAGPPVPSAAAGEEDEEEQQRDDGDGGASAPPAAALAGACWPPLARRRTRRRCRCGRRCAPACNACSRSVEWPHARAPPPHGIRGHSTGSRSPERG